MGHNHNHKHQDIATEDKVIKEELQGDVFFKEQMLTNPNRNGKKFYIESYGCQMNFSDSEIVAAILSEVGFEPTRDIDQTDLILINTCSIREKAEETVRKRLQYFNSLKRHRPHLLVGVLGCMAERLKGAFLEQEKIVDMVLGPDAYRDLPRLVATAEDGDKGMNVFLSREETYADINPVRLGGNGISAFVTIMRGCDNMCSFCVVPFTRGRERSRDAFSILAECSELFANGYKEVTLLGQNVDSYKWDNPETNQKVDFADLLLMVADIHPDLRVRFTTSHPKDMTDKVLYAMSSRENICKYIHLPPQSGSSRILKKMNRTYDRAWYMERVEAVYRIIPDCVLSADIITGFCTETEEDHQETLEVMRLSNYYMSYMFYYSERPGTLAARKYADDVDMETKKRRLEEVIQLQNQLSLEHNRQEVGKIHKILVEKDSKRSDLELCGRNSQNKMVVFPRQEAKVGDYVWVKITDFSQGTLRGELVEKPV